jgi:hypothetical protein
MVHKSFQDLEPVLALRASTAASMFGMVAAPYL